MTDKPTDIREHGVVDYDTVGTDDDYLPFRFKLGGELRQVDYPLASTKRDIQTAMAENRVSAMYELIFGGLWPDVAADLDALGPRGDDAQTHLVLDWMDHVGMNEETVAKYRASRQQRRAARKAAGRPGRP